MNKRVMQVVIIGIIKFVVNYISLVLIIIIAFSKNRCGIATQNCRTYCSAYVHIALNVT